jgi:hypothetical protein
MSHWFPPPAAHLGWYPHPMDQRLVPRRPLLGVTLAGGRATWHVAVRWIVIGFAALAALLMAIERHRVCHSWGACDAGDWSAPHSLATDVGATPFVFLAVVVAFQLAGYRRRMLASILSAVAAAAAAGVALAAVALVHFLSHVDGGGAGALFAFLAFALSLAQLILEPVLVAGMRRAVERDDPRFPRAAIVPR